jgi:transcriptional regulator with XRE-family HTH domain
MLPAAADLRTLRRRRGLSQQRLAELAGCSLSMVRVLESGYQPERSDVLPRVLLALNDPSTSPGHARNVTGTKTDVTASGDAVPA